MGEKIKNVILGILIVIGLSIEIIKIMPNPVFAYEKNIEKGLDKAIGKVRKYKTGDVVIPLKYDYAHDFRENLALVQIGNKKGYINKNGKIVIPLKYDYAHDFRENLAWVRLGNKYGCINKSGTLIIPAKYESLVYDGGNLIEVELNGRWGAIHR